MNYFAKLVNAVDVRDQAWMMSRPYLKNKEDVNWDDVLKMDMSLQSMAMICLHLKTSMAFREILTTIRPHFVWAQTSRVNPFDKMEIVDYVDEFESELQVMYTNELIDLSTLPKEEQDQNRMHLRMCTLTEYYCMLDFRTWIRLLKYLESDQPFYFKHYGNVIMKAMGLLKSELDKYKFSPIFKKENLERFESDPGIDKIGDFVLIRTTIPFALRAQLVRHLSIIVDDLIPFMPPIDLEQMQIKDLIVCHLFMKQSNWNDLFSKRICWLAQFSLYESLFSDYLDKITSFKLALPCKGSKLCCKYLGDMAGRISGKDPGLVCPIHKISKSQANETINQYINLFGSNKIIERYKEMINKEDIFNG